ncbi:MAG: hypothetical protein IOD12_03435 [Silvanigrellales bacterium]|nr:hypothetical protein [Silvanigrellales bacterium]
MQRAVLNLLFLAYEAVLAGTFFLVRVVGFVSDAPKLQRFIALRSRTHLAEALARVDALPVLPPSTERMWFHVASAGELEQAIPVARSLNERNGVRFVLSYFSPEAEPFLKNFPALDVAFGLPLDVRKSHQVLLRALRKKGHLRHLVFVRYDLWPGLLRTATDDGMRLSLLAGTARRARRGLAGLASVAWRRCVHASLNTVFTVEESDATVFARTARKACLVHAGDPKWARAKERAEELRQRGLSERLAPLASLCRAFQARGGKVFVFGSPHAEEHDVALQTAALEGALVVYVPHDVTPAALTSLEDRIREAGLEPRRLSEFDAGARLDVPLPDLFVVDAMGLLAEIYALADVAIVGGGFDGQLHNTLEPAAHPVAVVLGDRMNRAPEAEKLVLSGAARAFTSPEAMFQFLNACVRVADAPPSPRVHANPGVRPESHQLVELRRKALELFKRVPATSEVVSKTLFP